MNRPSDQISDVLFRPLTLPCGAVLKNRIAKSAMSDSLGDGTGHPSKVQQRLYERWAEGGLAVSIIGEVQCSPGFAEKPGNLVLNEASDLTRFEALARAGGRNNAQLWPQLGHAGAMAYPPTSVPKGPSALDLPGLACAEMSLDEIRDLPSKFARTARLARDAGFAGVQIHAAHGFLLSQFLSPLFNRRQDDYGGPVANRARLLLEVIEEVRHAVGAACPVAVKLNATDQLDGGLDEDDALSVVQILDGTSVDLIDISGGTYFPGAKPASDSGGAGPYFSAFAKRARKISDKPFMLTGGFKSLAQAAEAVATGATDMVGLARLLALEPALPDLWRAGERTEPHFPRFDDPPEGGITAWYTMRLTEIGEDRETMASGGLAETVRDYEARDTERTTRWLDHFRDPA